MPGEGPGARFSVTATKASQHNHPAVELNHAGIAAKSQQIPPGVPSIANAEAAVKIAIGEDFVIMMTGTHEFPSSLLPGGAAAGDQLWIGVADNKLLLTPEEGEVNPSVKVTVGATGGTWTITIDGAVSGAVQWNTTAAQLLAILEAMPNIEPGDVTVTGGPGATTPLVITFVDGEYADGPVPVITTATAGLEGAKTAVVANVAVGVEGTAAVKFGVIDEIDTDAELAHVNLTQRSSF